MFIKMEVIYVIKEYIYKYTLILTLLIIVKKLTFIKEKKLKSP